MRLLGFYCKGHGYIADAHRLHRADDRGSLNFQQVKADIARVNRRPQGIGEGRLLSYFCFDGPDLAH